MSSENTSRKVETGGFLGGHEFENHYVLDTLFLPTQEGYSDRFECTNNVQISDFFQEQVLNPQKGVSGPHNLKTSLFEKLQKRGQTDGQTDRPTDRTYLLSLLAGD